MYDRYNTNIEACKCTATSNCGCKNKPVNGIIEDLLNTNSSELVTVGVSLDTPTVIRLAVGIIAAGLIIKNVNFK